MKKKAKKKQQLISLSFQICSAGRDTGACVPPEKQNNIKKLLSISFEHLILLLNLVYKLYLKK